MGSLIRRRFQSFANSVARYQKTVTARRMQQTHAALNSTTETNQLSNEVIPVFKQAAQFGDRTALRDMHGDYTYRGLFLSARQFANELNELLGEGRQERIAFLLPNDASYVITQWACWISGQIAVPLNEQHPALVLDYYINDCDAKVFVTTQEHLPIIEPLLSKSKRQLIVFDNALRVLAMKTQDRLANKSYAAHDFGNTLDAGVPGDFYNKSNAMFVYTSGTTSKPKGVVLSHKNIHAQVNSLITAWKHTEKDIFLHTLPLHHVHGIINVLMCPLYVGGRCVMLPKFSASSVWSQITAVNLQNTERINVFAAVPTIYSKLIQEYDQLFAKNEKIKGYIHNVCSNKIRLMISGSAPLPKPVFDRWEEITGHRLLERYGMTEAGMILSNPLEGSRIPGTVGTPLPGVEVRLTETESSESSADKKGPKVLVYGNSKSSRVLNNAKEPVSGDLQVKGDNVFKSYWQRSEVTKQSFTRDGWFKTGDAVQYENGIYKMLGRSSVDIIKSGGYKISAVEVETAILGHPDISDCTVVGVDDLTWGQKVAAVVVLSEGSELILSQLREFAKKSLPKYAVPTILKVVNRIPKNSMGKVNKPDIIRILFPKEGSVETKSEQSKK